MATRMATKDQRFTAAPTPPKFDDVAVRDEDEDEEQSPPIALDGDGVPLPPPVPHKNKERSPPIALNKAGVRLPRVCLCVCAPLVLALGVALTVTLLVAGPWRDDAWSASGIGAQGEGVDGGTPTNYPTDHAATSVIPLAPSYAAMLRLLDPFLRTTESNAHLVKGTPQYAALRWVDATSRGETGDFDLSEWADADDAGGDDGGPLPALPLEQLGRLVQRYVLAVLYYSTAGELDDEWKPLVGWRDDANFLTDAHECEWSSSTTRGLGVTCDEDRRVTEVFLDGNGLAGTLPQNELHGLTELRSLDLSSNPDIKGPLPESLGRLPRLGYLFLSRNDLTGTVPASYGNLTTLREFSLADNKLTGSIPSEVSGMKLLTKIWLNQNDFTGGMNNFCQADIQGIILFYSDCFCSSNPKFEPEVECACCSICCAGSAGEWAEDHCHPQVPCMGDDCSYCGLP